MARASHVLAAKIHAGSNPKIMEKVFPMQEILFLFNKKSKRIGKANPFLF